MAGRDSARAFCKVFWCLRRDKGQRSYPAENLGRGFVFRKTDFKTFCLKKNCFGWH